jgi:hypothetical protein
VLNTKKFTRVKKKPREVNITIIIIITKEVLAEARDISEVKKKVKFKVREEAVETEAVIEEEVTAEVEVAKEAPTEVAEAKEPSESTIKMKMDSPL